MLSDMIKVCERVKHSRRTPLSSSSMPLGPQNATHVASRYMKRKIQIESRPKTLDCGNRRGHLDDPCPIHKNPKHTARQCRVSVFWTDNLPRGVPEVDECGLVEIGNSKEETTWHTI
jgi:hypothetical protein